MEAEERPMKLRKLSHGSDDQQASLNESLRKVLPRNMAEDDEDQPQKNQPVRSAIGTDADSRPQKDSPRKESAESISTCAAPLPASDLVNDFGLSKNQLKKLRKKQEWEAGREERKIIRKEKNQQKKARKREARDTGPTEDSLTTNGKAFKNGQNTNSHTSVPPGVPKQVSGTLLPITLIIDCAFDKLMHDRERISLASQITRSYSDNHRAPFKSHLVISSFGSELKKRFDTTLNQHYKNWKGFRVLEEDYVEAAEQSKEWMASEKGGKLAGAFAADSQCGQSTQELEREGEVVYLTSDSENTLERLKPYSTYIIGGLVDKNRHKGICYKSACDRGIKTAKLPIREYMEMQSRFVLATNHVVEIMVRWLECGDWGTAFLKVVPKRKGGKLKLTGEMQNGAGQEGEEVMENRDVDGNEDGVGQHGQEPDEGRTGEETRNGEHGAAHTSPKTAHSSSVARAEDG